MSVFIKAGLWLEKKIGYKGEFNLTKYVTDLIADTPPPTPTLPYKVYTALLTQSGEVAPTAVILENTLGGEVTFQYVGYGRFYIRKNFAFLPDKVMVLVNSIDKNNNKITTNKDLGANVIEIQTSSNDVLTNDILNSTSIEIRVYN